MPTRPALRSAWTPPYAAGFAVLALLLCIVTWAIPGCNSGECGGGSGDYGYEHVYTVRGRVTSLPSETPGSAFMMHHEPIPDYVSASGSIGMDAMVMSFAVPDPSVIDGLAVGDIVELVYGESLNPRVKQGVISATVLPTDTLLVFDPEEPDESPTDE